MSTSLRQVLATSPKCRSFSVWVESIGKLWVFLRMCNFIPLPSLRSQSKTSHSQGADFKPLLGWRLLCYLFSISLRCSSKVQKDKGRGEKFRNSLLLLPAFFGKSTRNKTLAWQASVTALRCGSWADTNPPSRKQFSSLSSLLLPLHSRRSQQHLHWGMAPTSPNGNYQESQEKETHSLSRELVFIHAAPHTIFAGGETSGDQEQNTQTFLPQTETKQDTSTEEVGGGSFLHAQLTPDSWVIMFVYGKFALLTSTLAIVDIKQKHQKA